MTQERMTPTLDELLAAVEGWFAEMNQWQKVAAVASIRSIAAAERDEARAEVERLRTENERMATIEVEHRRLCRDVFPPRDCLLCQSCAECDRIKTRCDGHKGALGVRECECEPAS